MKTILTLNVVCFIATSLILLIVMKSSGTVATDEDIGLVLLHDDTANDEYWYEVPDNDVEDDDNDDGEDHAAAKQLDIRSVMDNDIEVENGNDDEDYENKDLEKRRWIYKCSDSECKTRCQKLLKLPDGQCGNAGKCYCRRKTKGE